jgi:DNA-binding MarR family transcriptional regulator
MPDHAPPGATDVPDLGIVDALAQLTFLVQGALARRAAAHQLSMIQVRLLGVLRDRTPGMNELATMLELDKSSVSGLVDRASARGLVTRVPSAHDRRGVHVSLTEQGRAVVDDVSGDFATDIASIAGGLSSAQQARLTDLASRVVAHHTTGTTD